MHLVQADLFTVHGYGDMNFNYGLILRQNP